MGKFALLLFVGFSIQSVEAIPLPPRDAAVRSERHFSLLAADDEKIFNFRGTVRLSNCSGSIVRFEHSEDSDFALILTNGHCVRFMSGDEVVEHEQSSRRFRVLDEEGYTLGKVTASEVTYATMKKTDIAFYKLTSTYQEIRDQFQVEAFVLSKESPAIASPIEIVSGYWTRGYSCRIEAEVFRLREGDWTWSSALRYSRPGCEIIGGTSGSPVILEGTRTVVAVNNTFNEDDKECTLNNPCEVDEAGVVTHTQGYGYAQQTYWVYSCLSDKREIDTGVEGCLLPRPPARGQ